MGKNRKKPNLIQKTSIQSRPSAITDDLLLEIFLRLPDHRSAIRAAAVCKRWHSLISDPEFSTAFINHHNRRRTTNPDESPTPYTVVNQISSFSTIIVSKLESLTSGTAGYDLSFLPWSTPPAVLASCCDLLLVSELNSRTKFCVCNPMTKQHLALPPSPFLYDRYPTIGLVCHPNNRSKFKVCLIIDNRTTFDALLFCSETRQWTKAESVASFPSEDSYLVNPPVALDGVLYFAIKSIHGLRGVSAFSPFENPTMARPLALPPEMISHWLMAPVDDNIRLGVVQGRLRVLVILDPDVGFPMLVWELSESATWALVHDAVVKRRRPMPKRWYNDFICVATFDHNDGDAVFVQDKEDVLRYQISSKRYKKVGKFKFSVSERKFLGSPMKSFTLLHPPWPTPIIPSSAKAPL